MEVVLNSVLLGSRFPVINNKMEYGVNELRGIIGDATLVLEPDGNKNFYLGNIFLNVNDGFIDSATFERLADNNFHLVITEQDGERVVISNLVLHELMLLLNTLQIEWSVHTDSFYNKDYLILEVGKAVITVRLTNGLVHKIKLIM